MQAIDITNAQSRAFAVYNAFRKPAENQQKRKKDDCLHVYIHQRWKIISICCNSALYK